MIIKYKNQDLGLLLLRLGLATVFFFESINKIMNFAGTAKFFASLGFGVPVLSFVIAAELIAAIVFLLGIFPEWGYVTAIEMAVIIFKVRLPHGGFGSSFLELTLLVAALTLALSGPGRYSLEAKLAERAGMDATSSEHFFKEAAKEAERSLCLRDKCGAIVVFDGTIIGRGYNAPPNDDVASRKCGLDLVRSSKPKSDRTCCVHAEWRAIIDAVRNKKKLDGSTIFFTRVDADGNILKSGQPYCTVCSRLALDNGIGFFALWHENGIRTYNTKEYNELSYQFHRQ